MSEARQEFEKWAIKRELDLTPNPLQHPSRPWEFSDIVTEDHWQCAQHFYQAGLASRQAPGKKRLPNSSWKACGHPVYLGTDHCEECGNVQQEETTDQSATSPQGTCETSEPESGTSAQSATPTRTQDSGDSLTRQSPQEDWISVEERLPDAVMGKKYEPPEISDDVLVYFEGGDCQYEVANYDHLGKRWSMVAHGFKEPDCDPTHWRPLPAPPEVTK